MKRWIGTNMVDVYSWWRGAEADVWIQLVRGWIQPVGEAWYCSLLSLLRLACLRLTSARYVSHPTTIVQCLTGQYFRPPSSATGMYVFPATTTVVRDRPALAKSSLGALADFFSTLHRRAQTSDVQGRRWRPILGQFAQFAI